MEKNRFHETGEHAEPIHIINPSSPAGDPYNFSQSIQQEFYFTQHSTLCHCFNLDISPFAAPGANMRLCQCIQSVPLQQNVDISMALAAMH
jgi:hypothetical protein